MKFIWFFFQYKKYTEYICHPLPITLLPSGHSQLLTRSRHRWLGRGLWLPERYLYASLSAHMQCRSAGQYRLREWRTVESYLCPSQRKRCLALTLSSIKLILPK